VKPGITGWAQINYKYGSSLEDAKMKLEYLHQEPFSCPGSADHFPHRENDVVHARGELGSHPV
jgi:hypothetical protein